jgi:hypothetical protein
LVKYNQQGGVLEKEKREAKEMSREIKKWLRLCTEAMWCEKE